MGWLACILGTHLLRGYLELIERLICLYAQAQGAFRFTARRSLVPYRVLAAGAEPASQDGMHIAGGLPAFSAEQASMPGITLCPRQPCMYNTLST
jgi:hypothetical protein